MYFITWETHNYVSDESLATLIWMRQKWPHIIFGPQCKRLPERGLSRIGESDEQTENI